MYRSFSFLLVGLLLVFGCGEDKASALKPTNLLSYGLPITIMAPDSAKIEKMDLIVQQDVTVQKGSDYYVQIFASEASTTDLTKLKAEKLAEIKQNPFFTKVIQEDPNGFIFEQQFDSTQIYYGFRHFRIQGDREYVFQNGMIGKFSKESVEQMYEAVQPAKEVN